MAKEVVVNVKVTAEEAKENIKVLNKAFDESTVIVKSLEKELKKLEKELANTNGKTDESFRKQIRLGKEITKTKNAIEQEKNSLKGINKERKENTMERSVYS